MSSALPSGTVTFLFTDIEGSTRIWDAFPDEAREALGIHDRIVGDAVIRNGGHLVKHTGDGIFAAFDAAGGAVAAAAQAQAGIASAPWPDVVGTLGVRMAVHTATIEPTEDDYHGSDVNRVARIEASAHGGQVLLSATASALAAHDLPDGCELVDLGHHLLRGLGEPERIHQLSVPGLRAAFPPLRTSSTLETRLPRPTTSFVGRRAELEEVVDLVSGSDTRLVTLLGPGGIGKTRLAIEAARQASERTGVPAHFFSLDGIRSTGDVVKALGDSLGFVFDIHISAQISEQTQLFDRLAAQPLLLVLDNLEHLDDVSDLVAEMLERIPSVEVLATSRRQLDLSSEWRVEVRGLDQGNEADAVALFVDRARQAGAPQTSLAAGEEPIADLCRRLGGMPLAIELAAAWAGMLSPSEIADEIGRGLDLLESSARDTPDRHRSIRTVFEHSWDRLDEELRATFARLSVFEAPFDRFAASAVAGASLPDLMRLVKQSLVFRPELDRFALHPLLRELAAEALGDEGEAIAEAHARYFWSFLVERDEALSGSLDQMAVRDEVADQIDHIRSASDFWMDHYDDDEAVVAVRALYEFHFIHSFSDGLGHFQRLVERLAARHATPTSSRAYLWARVLEAELLSSFGTPDELSERLDPLEPPIREAGGELAAGWLMAKGIELCLRNDYETSIGRFEEALGVESGGRPVHSAVLLAWMGWAHFQLGDFATATATFDRGLEIAIGAHHWLGEAFLLSKSGLAADAAGDHDRAAQLHHEGREIFVKAGDLGGQGYTLSRLSWTSYLKGDFEVARRYALEGLAKFEEINHRWGIAVSYGRLGLAEVELGQVTSAAEHFLACLDEATSAGLVEQQHYAVTGIGIALAAAGQWPEAATILRQEIAEEKNPYQDFARRGLDRVLTTWHRTSRHSSSRSCWSGPGPGSPSWPGWTAEVGRTTSIRREEHACIDERGSALARFTEMVRIGSSAAKSSSVSRA